MVPSGALSACPTLNLSPAHWSQFSVDGRCNHDRLCGYRDEHGGPCVLPVDNHPRRGQLLLHDDGQRWQDGAWRH